MHSCRGNVSYIANKIITYVNKNYIAVNIIEMGNSALLADFFFSRHSGPPVDDFEIINIIFFAFQSFEAKSLSLLLITYENISDFRLSSRWVILKYLVQIPRFFKNYFSCISSFRLTCSTSKHHFIYIFGSITRIRSI